MTDVCFIIIKNTHGLVIKLMSCIPWTPVLLLLTTVLPTELGNGKDWVAKTDLLLCSICGHF